MRHSCVCMLYKRVPGGGGLYTCGTHLYVCYIKNAGWRRAVHMRHSFVCVLYKERWLEEGCN